MTTEGDGEAMSDAEARFERRRKILGRWLGPVAAAAAWWGARNGPEPLLAPLMALCAVWWICEAVPLAVTALLAAAGAVVLGLATPKEAFGTFGSPLLFLFVGSFFIAEAMKVHGLGERVARLMGRIARGRLSMMVFLSLAAFSLSLWMSNSAATAIILPIAVAVARAGGERRFGAAMVLAIAYGASVGGIGTPVGTPPNLIGIQALDRAGEHVGFLAWMEFGVPLGLIMLAAMWIVLALVFRLRPGQPLGGVAALTQRVPWRRGEIAVLIALGAAILGWLVPGILEAAWPDAAVTRTLKQHLPEEVVALLAGCLLFVLPADEPDGSARPALTWQEAARIDWGVILLFGGGILLGSLADKSGLSARWGTALIDLTGANGLWSLTALVTGAAILLSEATSNTATATLMAPLAANLAHAAGVSPIAPVLGATLGASFGFMLPISTAPNAMAYGTGMVTVPQMARAGVFFDLLGFVVIVAGLRLFVPLLF